MNQQQWFFRLQQRPQWHHWRNQMNQWWTSILIIGTVMMTTWWRRWYRRLQLCLHVAFVVDQRIVNYYSNGDDSDYWQTNSKVSHIGTNIAVAAVVVTTWWMEPCFLTKDNSRRHVFTVNVASCWSVIRQLCEPNSKWHTSTSYIVPLMFIESTSFIHLCCQTIFTAAIKNER